jgi:hypothetical protein
MPTIRQQKLAKKISDIIRNNGPVTINYGKLLKESGYADSVSKKPHLIIDSENFQTLLKKELGENKEWLDIQIKIAHNFLILQNTNFSVKARAIDMYYKSTGAYKQNKTTCNKCEKHEFIRNLSDQDLNYIIKTGEMPENIGL